MGLLGMSESGRVPGIPRMNSVLCPPNWAVSPELGELYLQRLRAKDETTGEPKRQQVADVLNRIESRSEPTRSLLRLCIGFPTPKDDPALYAPARRKALAALGKETVIGVLHGDEPIIPGDPDLGPEARNQLYGMLVDGILKHRDVFFTEAELAEVMKDATPRAKLCLEILSKEGK